MSSIFSTENEDYLELQSQINEAIANIRSLVKLWNSQTGDKKIVQIITVKYKPKPPKVAKPPKIKKERETKHVIVQCSTEECISKCHVPKGDFIKGDNYICKACDRVYRKSYASKYYRSKVQKIKNQAVVIGGEFQTMIPIDLEDQS